MLGTTIVALATTLSESALAIIRISGDRSLEIINKIFTNKIKEEDSHIVKYGFIKDPAKGTTIDEVMCVYFKGPKTFTGEDMVEIYCHGGILIIQHLLSVILNNGAVEASRGEFSMRAYLNGRIDLVQAEAINDMITAHTDDALQLALLGLKGKVSSLIVSLKDELSALLANIEVNIDYPEYDDVEQLTTSLVKPKVEQLIVKMEEIISDAKKGNIIKDGVTTAIVGKPNVGKSSLLNALIEQQKAIVTDIPGTTRDIVEGRVNIGGLTLNLLDTAGIRESNDVVEKIGIQKSIDTIKEASLVLLVLDASKPLEDEDYHLLDITKKSNRIIVYNKIDKVNDTTKFNEGILISAMNNQIEDLKVAIKEKVGVDPSILRNKPILSNTRHLLLMNQALNSLKEAYNGCVNLMPVDLISIDIKASLTSVLQLLGSEVNVDISKEIFSRFCLGK
jgi:tRNA modification GTPase